VLLRTLAGGGVFVEVGFIGARKHIWMVKEVGGGRLGMMGGESLAHAGASGTLCTS
jgi:hypothetical protein